MHISEGILSSPVLAGGAAVAAVGVAVGLRKMDQDAIPEVALISSVVFVASLLRIPLGPANVHLSLGGLTGLLLGWLSLPAFLVVLTLQAVLFQFGGFTTLGVNTVIMAFPAVMVFLVFGQSIRYGTPRRAFLSGFAAGALASAMGAFVLALCLASTGEGFAIVSRLVFLAHLPIFAIEGIITAFCVSFLREVKPELFEAAR